MKMKIIYKFADGIFGVAASIVVTTFIIITEVPLFKLMEMVIVLLIQREMKYQTKRRF